ncbi:MAG TPA: 3-isopropylmalate dehydrogenase [Stenomitos sp.]
MRTFKVALLGGDGIGPEVMGAAMRVLRETGDRFGFALDVTAGLIGQAALDAAKNALPIETIQLCRASDAVMLGPVGGSRWVKPTAMNHPKQAVLALQGWVGVYSNLRPIRVYQPLLESSTLKPEAVSGVDIMVVRDVSSGLLYGRPRGIETVEGRRVATNTETYSDREIERVARMAFGVAMSRRRQLVLADWGKVLETGLLWEEVVAEVARDYPEVDYRRLDLDTCILLLTLEPTAFDVILADNTSGDLLSVQASALTGTFALHPSALLGGQSGGLFSPSHGSAPDLEGKGIANPTAAILAGAMMLKYAFNLVDAAHAMRDAVIQALESGARTCDICPAGVKSLPTEAFTDQVLAYLPKKLEVPPLPAEAPKVQG